MNEEDEHLALIAEDAAAQALVGRSNRRDLTWVHEISIKVADINGQTMEMQREGREESERMQAAALLRRRVDVCRSLIEDHELRDAVGRAIHPYEPVQLTKLMEAEDGYRSQLEDLDGLVGSQE